MGSAPTEESTPQSVRNAQNKIGGRASLLSDEINLTPTMYDLSNRGRTTRGFELGGASAADTFRRFGVADFTGDNQRSFNMIRGLGRNDQALNQAANLYQNNAGVADLKNFDMAGAQTNAERALQNYQPTALRGLNFNDLDALQFEQAGGIDGLAGVEHLQSLVAGDNLDVANNQYLADALGVAQRQMTDRYTQEIAPALASQFGGGFGLGSSSALKAQQGAADDFTRNMSEQATLAYFDQFNRERSAQDSAAQYLGGLDLNRMQNLDALNLSRESELAGLGLSRAGQIDQARLSRAGALNQSGQAFAGMTVDQANALASQQNAQAAGLSNVGQARRAQQMQYANALNDIGNQQMSRDEALYRAKEAAMTGSLDSRLRQFGELSRIVGQNATPGGGGGGGASPAMGALGGAATGAYVGSYFGPYGTAIGAIGGGALGYFGTA